MAYWFIMMIMAISLNSPFVAGINFTFDYPSEVNTGEEFEVEILAETNETLDVKIFVYDDTKEFSEIFDGTNWKSSRYYLNGVFPSQNIFKVRSHFIGETEICVKLRKNGGSNADSICLPIEVLPQEPSEDNNTYSEQNESDSEFDEDEESQDSSEESNDEDEDQSSENIDNSKVENTQSASNLNFTQIKQNKKIILGDNENKPDEFVSEQEKIRTGVVYGFTGLVVLIAVLLALRKL